MSDGFRDRAPPGEPGSFFTVEDIGPNRSLTPEGFLVCYDVPVARVGLQLYGPGETPVQLGVSGIVQVERDAEEVFHPECLASLQGKPIVDEHPEDDGLKLDVTPQNWKELAVGAVLNPRRGDGENKEFVVVDLIICDQAAIAAVQDGKVELSVGYDADYAQDAPGHGRQLNIRCNHIALVERGRCGPRCAIGDKMLPGLPAITCPRCGGEHEECAMTTTQAQPNGGAKPGWRDAIRSAFFGRDQAALEAILKGRDQEPPNGGLNDNGEGEPPAPSPPEPASVKHEIHIHPPGAAAAPAAPNGGGDQDPGGGLSQAEFARMHQELDEIWDAINAVAGGTPPRDSYDARDRRRKAGDQGSGGSDELGAAPGNQEGKITLPGFEIEAPPGTQTGDARKARDSALFEDSFADTIALGEILIPGIAVPTFDKAAKPKTTFDALCSFRRKVFDLAWHQPDTRPFIELASGGRYDGQIAGVACDRLRDWFFAAGAMKAQANLAGNARDGRLAAAFSGAGNRDAGPIRSNDDWQKEIDKYYAGQKAAQH